MSVNEAFGIMD